MSANSTDAILIARRYATAIFAEAAKAKKEETITQEFSVLAQAISSNAEFGKALGSPLVSRAEKVAVLAALAKSGDVLTQKSVAVVARGGRADLVPAIASLLKEELGKQRGELSAVVTSARSLNDATQKQLKAALAKATGKATQVAFTENPELLGGLVIELGSLRLDASLSGALNQMRGELTAPTNAA